VVRRVVRSAGRPLKSGSVVSAGRGRVGSPSFSGWCVARFVSVAIVSRSSGWGPSAPSVLNVLVQILKARAHKLRQYLGFEFHGGSPNYLFGRLWRVRIRVWVRVGVRVRVKNPSPPLP